MTSSTVLLSDPTINYAMATEVDLGGAGQRLVTYRKIDDLSGANKDLGKIARRWFGSFTSGTSEVELVLTNSANRPHTSVISVELPLTRAGEDNPRSFKRDPGPGARRRRWQGPHTAHDRNSRSADGASALRTPLP